MYYQQFSIPFNRNTTITAVLLGWNYVQVKVNSIVPPQLSSKMYYHRKNNKDNQ